MLQPFSVFLYLGIRDGTILVIRNIKIPKPSRVHYITFLQCNVTMFKLKLINKMLTFNNEVHEFVNGFLKYMIQVQISLFKL